MAASIFRMDHVSAWKNMTRQLNDFCIDCREGQITGLVGPSNSGKTAVCSILSGTEPIRDGRLYYHNKPVEGLQFPRDATEHVLLIDANTLLPSSLTVAEFLALAEPDRKTRVFINQNAIRGEGERVLQIFAANIRPTDRISALHRYQHHLVAIAGAYLKHAELIIINNLVSAYTDAEWEKISAALRAASYSGISVLLTSGRQNRMAEICDRIALLDAGSNIKEFSSERFVRMQKSYGRRQAENIPAPLSAARESEQGESDEVFRAEDVSVGSLEHIGFSVSSGEIVGFFDPENAACQELFQAIENGNPGEGMFLLEEKQIRCRSLAGLADRGIGFISAHNHDIEELLFPGMSAFDNIICVSHRRLGRGFLFHRRSLRYLAKVEARRIGIDRKDMKLPVERFDTLGKLRIYLCRMEMMPLKILFCNSLFETADEEVSAELEHFLRRLSAGGTAVCLFGYDLQPLRRICSRIYRIGEDGAALMFPDHMQTCGAPGK